MSKRSTNQAGLVENESDYLEVTPLGAGCEVGRSCHILKFKGKTIMLDCGLHPAYSGIASLPYFDEIDPAEIDIILITHFHLDHAAALPYFLQKTAFRGTCYMTFPTKSIYKLILQDYVKVSTLSIEETLYTEADLLASMDRIKPINYHETIVDGGVKFTAYNAGHVLGAAMFLIEIGGVRVLYTGDYSRKEDRHLAAAELPPPHMYPDVLIIEATYGTQQLSPVEERETRFCTLVREVVEGRGGCCLIPVFALGRAQELLLILDEYWESEPSLQHINIYYASFLAKKCMRVYQTYLHMMNKHIQQLARTSNPFQFKHILPLKSLSDFDDSVPCVMMASPGMLQNGLSRELLELWCSDERNGVIIPGYAVEGTMAKHIMTEPAYITSLNGSKLPLKLSVHYVSFSAHADYSETSEFISLLHPKHVILVHGDANEGVGKLKTALLDTYKGNMNVVGPKNCQTVEIEFRQTKIVKVVGSAAEKMKSNIGTKSENADNENGVPIAGVLVKKDFSYTLVETEELAQFTPIHSTILTQTLRVPFYQTYACLHSFIGQLYDIGPLPHTKSDPGKINKDEKEGTKISPVSSTASRDYPPILITQNLSVTYCDKTDTVPQSHIQLDWESNPVSDMIVDSLLSLLLTATSTVGGAKLVGVSHQHGDKTHIKTKQESNSGNTAERMVTDDKTTEQETLIAPTPAIDFSTIATPSSDTDSAATSISTPSSPVTPASIIPNYDLFYYLTQQYGTIHTDSIANLYHFYVQNEYVTVNPTTSEVICDDRSVYARVRSTVLRALTALFPLKQEWVGEEEILDESIRAGEDDEFDI